MGAANSPAPFRGRTQEERGMTARKMIRAKFNQLRQQSQRTGQVRMSASALALAARAGIHLLLAAVLSGR